MNINRKFLYLGVFLLSAGGVLLLAQAGVITNEAIAEALRLWPLAVIAIGAAILLRATRFATAGIVVAAILPGLLAGGLAAATPRFDMSCTDIVPVSATTREGTLAGDASVELRLGCGDLTVTTASGNGWQLHSGGGMQPIVEASGDRLRVVSPSRSLLASTRRDAGDWRIALPTSSRLDLVAGVSAGDGRLDLSGARLGTVALDVNAGDLRADLRTATLDYLSVVVNAARGHVVLPAGQDTVADIVVNAGDVDLCVPDGLGIEIRQPHSALSTVSYAGLVRSGDAWRSPDYATATHHADVSITTNVGSVDINPEGGCK